MARWKFSDYILLVLRGLIEGIIYNLTQEDSPSKIHAKQGELEGLKMLQDKIITEFGPLEGTMLREDVPPGIDSIGKAALEHFHSQILEHSDVWKRIGDFISSCDDRAMRDLYESTETVTRDMKRSHGKRDGLRKAHEIIDKVSETLDYARENPELPGIEEEVQTVIEFPAPDQEGEDSTEAYVGPHYRCLACGKVTGHDDLADGPNDTLLCPDCMGENLEKVRSLDVPGEEDAQ
ncbi:MAG: hypothetical protein PQJ60_10825 [Spirochaetales bacterium]|nr:hypothetical protein [Spirochaetales bacterium]